MEPRNTPTVINSVFHFTNFMDGRANNIFNGNNPFGPADPRKNLIITTPTTGLMSQRFLLRQSALASQAVAPRSATLRCPGGAAPGPRSARRCSA